MTTTPIRASERGVTIAYDLEIGYATAVILARTYRVKVGFALQLSVGVRE